jgi:hypothetical protein
VLLIALVPVTFFVEIAWNNAQVFVGVPAMGPVVLLFAITGLLSLPALRRIGFTRRELLTMYTILLVAGPLVSRSTTAWVLASSISYYWMSQVHIIWQTTFLDQVPTWFAPSDAYAVERFFLGHSHVPWADWWTPLAAWGAFMMALFLCFLCLLSVLQRQWIRNERLTFPLAQVPLAIVSNAGERGGKGLVSLPTGWPFWIGVVVSLGITFTNALSLRWPAVPSLPLGPLLLMRSHRVGPAGGIGEVYLLLWPWLIALAYLIPKELSLSCWLFWWLLVIANVIGVYVGAEPRDPAWIWDSNFPAPRFQGGGALLPGARLSYRSRATAGNSRRE